MSRLFSRARVSAAFQNSFDPKANKLFDVSNYSVIATGGGAGIELMITQSLVANGAKVYITGRWKEALATVVEKYNTGPSEIIASIQRMVKEVESKEPKDIHLPVNNAGIARDDNTKYSNGAPDFKATGFLLLLAKSGESTPGYSPGIINITSILGVMKGSSNGQLAYVSSKAAFIHLTRMTTTTFVQAKIRRSNEHQKSELDSEASNPSGHYGHDTDMADCALFLAGPSGTFLNG
ncbi:putative Rhamnolipids biosynthesis 3-oxoacyl-reductase [Halenospora varia]|nr:putative Rhamnolipids biosynthesis 3-oxoacyl-reductase [Halenospora varia]